MNDSEPGVIFRRIEEEDLSIYKAIRLEALRMDPYAFAAKYEEAIQRGEESWIDQVRELATSDGACLFMAMQNTKAIGLCGLYRRIEDPCQGELVQVWISPEYRGSSVARSLLNTILDWAKETGIERVLAVVHSDNPRALRFYDKLGFVHTRSEGRDEYLMRQI